MKIEKIGNDYKYTLDVDEHKTFHRIFEKLKNAEDIIQQCVNLFTESEEEVINGFLEIEIKL